MGVGSGPGGAACAAAGAFAAAGALGEAGPAAAAVLGRAGWAGGSRDGDGAGTAHAAASHIRRSSNETRDRAPGRHQPPGPSISSPPVPLPVGEGGIARTLPLSRGESGRGRVLAESSCHIPAATAQGLVCGVERGDWLQQRQRPLIDGAGIAPRGSLGKPATASSEFRLRGTSLAGGEGGGRRRDRVASGCHGPRDSQSRRPARAVDARTQ